jgi:hypothetical protein
MSKGAIVAIIGAVVVLCCSVTAGIGYFFSNASYLCFIPGICNKTDSIQTNIIIDTSPEPQDITQDITPDPLVTGYNYFAQEEFKKKPIDWQYHIWFSPKESSTEISFGIDGVTFQNNGANSRAGIMKEINADVTKYNVLILQANVKVDTQSLSGTGLNGREAPLAIGVAYKDVNGLDHKLQSEDPTLPGQMFWQGFYYMDPTGQYGKDINGTKVAQGEEYTYSIDLMELSPKPAYIYYVGAEGAGWSPRKGSISSLVLTGTK